MHRALVSAVMIVTAAATASDFDHELLVDAQHGVRLRWSLTPTSIRMRLQANVNGYVAVGWSKTGLMTDSFVAFGSADQAPVELLISSKAPDGIRVAPDAPLYNASASTTNGVTAMTFSRPIQQADRPIPTQTRASMIWAVHATSRDRVQHTASGSFALTLSTPDSNDGAAVQRRSTLPAWMVVFGPRSDDTFL